MQSVNEQSSDFWSFELVLSSDEEDEDLNRKPAAKTDGQAKATTLFQTNDTRAVNKAAEPEGIRSPVARLPDRSTEARISVGDDVSNGRAEYASFAQTSRRKNDKVLTSHKNTDTDETLEQKDDKELRYQAQLAAFRSKVKSYKDEQQRTSRADAFRRQVDQRREEHDVKVAIELQARINQAEKESEEQRMTSTYRGRAWKFVEHVLELHKGMGNVLNYSPYFDVVAVDDLVFQAEALLRTQKQFHSDGKPTFVDIGYHYTKRENMSRIKTDGLLTKYERERNEIQSPYNGSRYGDGVYTGNGPLDYLGIYGDMGLIVARLKGVTNETPGYCDSVTPSGRPMTVLASSSQCVALVEYSASVLHSSVRSYGMDDVRLYQMELQTLIDTFFNGGTSTKIVKRAPAPTTSASQIAGVAPSAANSTMNAGQASQMSSAFGASSHAGTVGFNSGVVGSTSTLFGAAVPPAGASLVPPPTHANSVATFSSANAFGAGQTSGFSHTTQGNVHHNTVVLGRNGPSTAGTTHASSQHASTFGSNSGAAISVPPAAQPNASAIWHSTQAFASYPGTHGYRSGTASAFGSTQTFGAAIRPTGALPSSGRAPVSTHPFGSGQAGGFSHSSRGNPSLQQTHSAQPSSGTGIQEMIRYEAPSRLHGSRSTDIFQEVKRQDPDEECAICLSSLCCSEKVVSIKVCGHVFHETCVKHALQHSKACPICRKLLGKPEGKMPSGTMTVSPCSYTTCTGFGPGSIIIIYDIESGAQKSYHPNPGVFHGAARRFAYLPDNDQGWKLLKRLKFAFRHGLTFTIGTSLSSGQPNQVTWSSIHHKTRPDGGAHGFPDPAYFLNCNQELDSLNVPSADDL